MVRLFVVLLFLLPAWLYGQEEEILDYQSDIEVRVDGSLHVKETIKVRSLQREILRGIFRSFPVMYRDQYNNRIKVEFEVEEVTREGKQEPFELSKEGDFQIIRIGDPDVFLEDGVHTYTLSYTTNRQIGYFEKYDELYWNVIGDSWAFPIRQANARIRLPVGAEIIQHAAYSGPFGSMGCECEVSQEDERTLAIKLTKPLNPQEALTVALAWPKDVISRPTVLKRRLTFFGDNAGVLFGSVAVFVLLVYYLYAWAKVGRDPKRGGVYPQFEVPQHLDAAAIRYLYKMGFDQTAFTASIIQLATKGMLRIREERRGKYSLERLEHETDSLDPYQRSIIAGLFASSDTVRLDQSEHRKIGAAMTAVQKHLKSNYQGKYFRLNYRWLAPGIVFSVAAIVMIFTVTFPLRFDTEKALLVFGAIGALFTAGALASFLFNVHLAFDGGSYSVWKLLGQAVFIAVMLAIVFFLEAYLSVRLEYGLLVVFFLLGFINCMFFYLIKAPTPTGRKVMDEIEGFRMYLNAAEKPYIQQLNPPGLTPETFERYLPYAIALGVGATWGKAFEDRLKSMGEATGSSGSYLPAWYVGNSFKGGAVSNFSQGLSRNFSAVLTTSASPPGSKSGSGGGGSSGGGGGGGGGGGW